ncbi:MAG: phytoene desaturase family protein [Candidatus Dormibacteraceae bacterium]
MGAADAVVIGSGPNGLVAACLLARAGWSVTVLEAAQVAGGAVRTEELTLPGHLHDSFSAFYGMLHASPVFGELGLDRRLEWRHFEVPVAAGVSPQAAAACHRDPERTAAALTAISPGDGEAWLELWRWWQTAGRRVLRLMLGPLPPSPPAVLRLLRSTGLRGSLELARMLIEPVEVLSRNHFRSEPARALLAGGISHSDLSVEATGGVPLALVLAMVAQDVGMPVPAGGAGKLAEALVGAVEEAGGTVTVGARVERVLIAGGRAAGVELAGGERVEARRAVLAGTGPLVLFRDLVGEEHVPRAYLEGLRRFRPGSGIFKLDLALRGPAPWTAAALRDAGVVHLTGSLEQMARSSFEVHRGLLPGRPLLVVGQQSLADASRAPSGAHTLWLETHVPASPRGDGDRAGALAGGWAEAKAPFQERVLDLLEGHAPGLHGLIAGAFARTPDELERENPNLAGGDLGGGSMAPDQQLFLRPVPGWFRYATPIPGLYLCSASTHPGGGVHGMAGRNCARRVLRDARLARLPRSSSSAVVRRGWPPRGGAHS